MSKNKFEVVDYESAVKLYGDIELTFYDYWKHSFRYDNEELGLRVYLSSDDIYRIPLSNKITINGTAWLHHNTDENDEYYKELDQELRISIYKELQ